MRGTRHRYGWDEGATAVEAAITLSILLVLLIGIFNFGTALWQLNTMQLAVEQAGRWAMINNANYTQSGADQQMSLVISGTTTGTPTCTLTGTTINPPTAGNICVYAGARTTGTSPNPDTATLTATYAYQVLGISGTLTVGSQGTFPLD